MPSPAGRTLVLFNPQARAGNAGAVADALPGLLRQAGIEADLRLTEGPGDACAQVAGLRSGAFTTVVAAGGDGTLFEVVNGLMARPAGDRPGLAVLPLGTGNAFARDLGLAPGDLSGAIDLLASGAAGPVDVAELTCPGDHFYFINMLGLGLVTEAARSGARLKWLGQGAYTLGALRAVASSPRLALQLELDGVSLATRDSLFAEVANSRYTGTHFLMSPASKIDDGLLELVLVDHLPRRRALRLFPSIYVGEHLKAPEVSVHRFRELKLVAPEELACAVDGEFRGGTPLTVRCLPGALRVIGVPPLSAV